MRSSRLVAILLLAALAPAQRVAAPGDTVRVTGGGAYMSLALSKAITVEAAAPTTLGLLAPVMISVSGIPAGSTARVSGFSLAWLDSPGSANLGGPVTVSLRGTPLTAAQLFLDAGFGVTPVPWADTPYLGSAAPAYVATFAIGPAGVLPLTFTVPYVPALSGSMFYLHALTLDPGTSALSLTNLGDLQLR